MQAIKDFEKSQQRKALKNKGESKKYAAEGADIEKKARNSLARVETSLKNNLEKDLEDVAKIVRTIVMATQFADKHLGQEAGSWNSDNTLIITPFHLKKGSSSENVAEAIEKMRNKVNELYPLEEYPAGSPIAITYYGNEIKVTTNIAIIKSHTKKRPAINRAAAE